MAPTQDHNEIESVEAGYVTGRQSMQEPQNYNDNYDSETSEDEDEIEQEKPKLKRPSDNAFRQQRLKAYNPVFTAKTVIPLLICIAAIFTPLGGAMWLASHRVQDLAIDYSQCERLALKDFYSDIPTEYLDFRLKNFKNTDAKATWKLATDDSQPFADERNVCLIRFELPHELKGPIYFFYRLKNFYANHRRYAKSFSEDQIQGKAALLSTIKDTVGQNCEPLLTDPATGKRYYPCGLIANSLFNDTYSTTLTAVNGTSKDYTMTEKDIAWKSNKNRYKKTTYSYKDVVPPPNWYKKYPQGYNSTNMPDILTWLQFQNWMITAGLPTFNKLALRNDDEAIPQGTYEVRIGLHFPVLPYKGHKYIYILQRLVIGGKNPFLGISWMVAGGICVLLAIVLLTVNLVKPRRPGDVNLLSWNKEKFQRDE